MGLLRAGAGALGGSLADQWKEFFYCDAIDVDTLVVKGQKRMSKRSSNRKGEENIISNGSGIAVADGQCMMIVEQGKIVEVCAEPGEYTYDISTEPSIFTGNLGQSIVDSFKTMGKRFTYGGDTGKDQRIYYINTKEILGNKFGTATPIMFDVVNKRIGYAKTVNIRCNGIYSYRITDPILFYKNVCGNVEQTYDREQIDGQLKGEFIDALGPAFAELTELELRPAQIPAHVKELKKAMNETLKDDWQNHRGITIEKIALNPITLTQEDMDAIQQMEDSVSLGSNASMMAGRMTGATASAMEKAASNPNGAMMGFMGMNMAGGAGNGGFAAAQDFYNKGQQQQKPAYSTVNNWTCECGTVNTGKFCTECGKPKPTETSWTCVCGTVNTGKFCTECGKPKPEKTGWVCSCGAVNKGKFCTQCGKPKPASEPLYRCDKCGWEPEDPKNPPKFCPQCGDPFDDKDIQ